MILSSGFNFQLTTIILISAFLKPSYSIDDFNFIKITESEVENQLTQKCASDIHRLNNNLINHTRWAVRMWDASAKVTEGLFQRNKYMLGNFDECLEIHEDSEIGMERQYCLSYLQLENKNPNEDLKNKTSIKAKLFENGNGMLWAVCVPKSCTNQDLSIALQNYSYFAHLFEKFDLKHRVLLNACQTNRTGDPYSAGTISFLTIGLLLCVLAVGATIYHWKLEVWNKNNESKDVCPNYIKAFSILSNCRQLCTKDEKSLRMTYGFRVFCSLYLIIFHYMGIFGTGPLKNMDHYESCTILDDIGRAFMQLTGTVVDTFFVLGGFFALFALKRTFLNKNVAEIILTRFVRLAPLYMMILFYTATLLPQTSHGPLWHLVEAEAQACRTNWWVNLLLLNNYVNTPEMCMLHMWYVACDFHFYIITIALCFFLCYPKREKFGLIICGVLLALSFLIPALITFVREFPADLFLNNEFLSEPRKSEYFNTMYVPTHTRMAPYIIGILAAWLYDRYKGTNNKISKTYSIVGFLTLLFIYLLKATLFVKMFDPIPPYSPISTMLYAGFNRIINGVCIAGMMLTFIFGDIPIVVAFMGCAPMIVIGKLTFGAFLISLSLEISSEASLQVLRYFSWSSLMRDSGWFIVESFFFSFIAFLTIEAPSNALYKMFLNSKKPKTAN